LTGFLTGAFLKGGFYSLGTVRAAFLAFETTVFSFFESALRVKRLVV
jgi:hypothetical protein